MNAERPTQGFNNISDLVRLLKISPDAQQRYRVLNKIHKGLKSGISDQDKLEVIGACDVGLYFLGSDLLSRSSICESVKKLDIICTLVREETATSAQPAKEALIRIFNKGKIGQVIYCGAGEVEVPTIRDKYTANALTHILKKVKDIVKHSPDIFSEYDINCFCTYVRNGDYTLEFKQMQDSLKKTFVDAKLEPSNPGIIARWFHPARK